MYILYKNQFIYKNTDKDAFVFWLALSEDFTQIIDEVPLRTDLAAEDIIPIRSYLIDGCEILWILSE